MQSEKTIEIIGSNVRIDDDHNIIPAGFLRSPLPKGIRVIIQARHECFDSYEYPLTTLDIKLLCEDGTPFFARKLDNSCYHEGNPEEHEEFYFGLNTWTILEFAETDICNKPGADVSLIDRFNDEIYAENVDGGIVMSVEIDEVFFGESGTPDCDAISIEFDVSPEAFTVFAQRLRDSIPASVLQRAEDNWKEVQKSRAESIREKGWYVR